VGKIVFWLIVVFVGLFVLRLYNYHQLQKRNAAKRARRDAAPKLAEPMVRCVRCGVFLPKSDARRLPAGFACPTECQPPKNR
jgi:hypothetical protein